MSIRRQSCDSCFKGRRKCDLAYPQCGRCQRNHKTCHYVYPPRLPGGDKAEKPSTTATRRSAETNLAVLSAISGQTGSGLNDLEAHVQLDHGRLMMLLGELRGQSIPRTPGQLGEPQDLSSSLREHAWVLDQIRDCPLKFASQGETIFIHRDLFRSRLPAPLRTAFGICSGAASMNQRNRPFLFDVLTAEITDLLSPLPTSTLFENLARLQAAVLYQVIRFFYGSLEQRIIAERQELLIRSFGLKLIQQADIELRQMQPDWEAWILAESIRRTVVVAFKLYTLYWTFKYGVCIETRAMNMLPVSVNPCAWVSREVYLRNADRDETTTYAEFATIWGTSPREEPDNFEKLLLVGCSGIETFNALLSRPAVEF